MKPDSSAPVGASARARQIFWTLLKFSAAGVLLWWLWRSGQLDFSRLARVRLGGAFFAMMGFQVAMLGCIAARWHFLTRAFDLNLTPLQSLRIGCIGNFAAVWTPAGLGLDGARLVLARRLAPQRLGALTASILWDRIFGVWTLACLSTPACAILLFDSTAGLNFLSLNFPDLNAPLRRTLALLLVACGVLALSPLLWRTRALEIFARRWPLLQKFSSANLQCNSIKNHQLKNNHWQRALAFSFGAHICNFLSLWCALVALEIVAAPARVLLAAPVVVLSSLLPFTPLGLGVTDAAASTLLRAVGVGGGGEATMLGRATFVLISAACGLAWLWPTPQTSTPVERIELETAALETENEISNSPSH